MDEYISIWNDLMHALFALEHKSEFQNTAWIYTILKHMCKNGDIKLSFSSERY